MGDTGGAGSGPGGEGSSGPGRLRLIFADHPASIIPRLDHPKPNLPPGAPHPDAPSAPKPPSRYHHLAAVGIGLMAASTVAVAGLVWVGGGW